MSEVLIRKEFTFDAAHNLVEYHGKCERLHGHTYRVAVIVKGIPDKERMVMDFCELSSIVKERVINTLDHSYINEILTQPTAENIAIWIWEQIEQAILRDNCSLEIVEVWETASSCAILCREDMKSWGRSHA
jgi:6-pyruvoyltetrahydropterin/6-carboxytetrahydropterin synthase